MKKLMMLVALVAVMGMMTGCVTRATAYTKTFPDGSKESRVSIVGTGDKASEVAAEGLFADGTAEDLGAGVKSAKANQQSTGIDGTINALTGLCANLAQLAAASQGVKVPAAASVAAPTASTKATDAAEAVEYIPATKAYSTDGYDGVPGADGIGVYGQTSCSRCRAYKAAHPDAKIIDVSVASNASVMWAALKKRGFNAASAALPVLITADGYTLSAK